MSMPYIIQDTTLEDIADAIRSKTDTTELIDPADMTDKINSISVTDEDDVLRDLRGSFTANVGDGYNNKSLAEMVGTAEGRSDSPGGGVIGGENNNAYNDGEIYGIRAAIGTLANSLSEDTFNVGPFSKINGSVDIIAESLADIKSKVVATLNAILDPEEPYGSQTTWTDIKELVENLPDDVTNITTSSIEESGAALRSDVDDVLSGIVTEYDLDVELVVGSWAATLANIAEVCEALAAQSAPSAPPVIQPLTVTDNGTYSAPSGVDGYSPVTVNVPKRTAQDVENANTVSVWNDVWASQTGTFDGRGLTNYTGELPYINASGCTLFANNSFSNLKCTKLHVSVGSNATSFNHGFSSNSNLVELTIDGSTSNVTSYYYTFEKNPNLKKINGEIDFTNATNVTGMFSFLSLIEDIQLKKNSLTISNNFDFGQDVNKKAILSVINALGIVSDNQTTTHRTKIKDNMGVNSTPVWFCKLVDDEYVDCESTDEGAMSYAQAINAKGWTIV